MIKKIKIAIFAQEIVNKGGTERIILEQARLFKADIYTGRYEKDKTFEGFKNLNVKTIKSKFSGKLRSLFLFFKFRKIKFKEKYDLYIFHGGSSLGLAKNHHPNMWYCHCPIRWLYDMYVDELKKLRGIKRILFIVFSSIIKIIDKSNVKNIDKIVTNSINVKNRVKRIYKRDSEVIYPFVDIDKFRWISQKNYYLSTGRIDSIKRPYLAVNAFKKMPDKKLIVASGGPDLDKIKKLAKGYKNIEILGWVSEKKLKELYGNCIATIYLSYKEDFGMVPIESMSCGKPCIVTDEGGFKETVIDKKTGLRINPLKQKNIIKAVSMLDKARALKMKEDCKKRANLFSKKCFEKKMLKVVKEIVRKYK